MAVGGPGRLVFKGLAVWVGTSPSAVLWPTAGAFDRALTVFFAPLCLCLPSAVLLSSLHVDSDVKFMRTEQTGRRRNIGEGVCVSLPLFASEYWQSLLTKAFSGLS